MTADCPPEEHDDSPGYGADGEFDTALEELVMNEADALGSRFAGASWGSDGTVVFRITGGAVPKELRDHPKVRIVKVRFSDDRLEAAMDVVVDRLNRLLAPDGQPMPNGAWPWWAHIDMERNIVGVMVDSSQRPKDAAIRRALADEMRAGTVQMCYGPVPVAHDAVGVAES